MASSTPYASMAGAESEEKWGMGYRAAAAPTLSVNVVRGDAGRRLGRRHHRHKGPLPAGGQRQRPGSVEANVGQAAREGGRQPGAAAVHVRHGRGREARRDGRERPLARRGSRRQQRLDASAEEGGEQLDGPRCWGDEGGGVERRRCRCRCRATVRVGRLSSRGADVGARVGVDLCVGLSVNGGCDGVVGVCPLMG